ncbi:MAG: hypothetical protein JWQ83_1832 [Lacunisphaera sp.]|nr:hypothetical protein [Lacunisphaera sp.]MDB6166692.1 hypothetical protein [Lacunisphaera sp.]
MNKSTKLLSLILAASAAGVAAFAFASSQYSAGLDGDLILGAGAALAITGLAIFDYSRRPQPLSLPVPVLRPRLPAKVSRRNPPQFSRRRAERELVA